MILQFGTSRFLQAHVDLFAWQARESGQHVPEIVIVQVTDDPVRARRLPAFAAAEGFPVIVRGLEGGQPVERSERVRSVVGGLSASRDWATLTDLFIRSTTHVVSNTGDTGYDVDAGEMAELGGPVAPRSFLAMLAALLHRRWRAGGEGITFLPCELVPGNGTLLHRRVREVATRGHAGAEFLHWLDAECLWVNTLVDRIVSEAIEPAGAVAEPYALWAIEQQAGLKLPFVHGAITITDDLAPFERLKLHILNLGHTVLAQAWLDAGARDGMTVREALAIPEFGNKLGRIFADEVEPGFAAHGMKEAATTYVATALDRFANPYLDHRLADIAAHHGAKVERRIGTFLHWAHESPGSPPMPRLRAIAESN